MKIAIHNRKGSFSERWIAYCKNNKVDYKIVNAFDNDIIEQLSGFDVFMWHHHHNEFKDALTSKRILFALEHAGIKVFPDFKTGWHFDDKVAQKYLFEALGAPTVPSYVFYDKKIAQQWIDSTCFPKVFKLKGGAGAANVKLVYNTKQAKKLVNQAFGKGFSQFDGISYVTDAYQKYRSGQKSFFSALKACGRLLIKPKFAKLQPKEQGYIYFQDFIPNNDSDLRVIIVDNKAFAVKRMVRKGDFRASGSGVKVYEKERIDINCIKIAFEVNKQLKSQSAAFDFIWDNNDKPYLVELSYGFAIDFYDPCPGYWDETLQWHEGTFNPQEWMLKNFVKNIQ
eukprot:TRINITY_DN126_c0_g1_i3.p2 TRINITY_DN126_c0_g1~~TRINITY_DN126_c0_g1_i3.p2  ORF type:complete len:339 (+),score=69.91 TRINITY_DN126_c0_g1_i3:1100-2116(+)